MIKNLRAYRLEKNLQQKELAAIVGIPTSTIACYETQSNEPNLKTLIKIANALDVSVDALIRDDIDIFPISKVDQQKLTEAIRVLQNLKPTKKTPKNDEGRRIKKTKKNKIDQDTTNNNNNILNN